MRSLLAFASPRALKAANAASRLRSYATASTPPGFYLPTVDVAPFIADPTCKEAQKVVDDVRAACRSTGFFLLKNHTVKPEVQNAAFDTARWFFSLPMDEKRKLEAKKTVGHRGYDLLASQAYEKDVLPDLKEGFYVGEDLPLDDPRVQARRFFMGQNVWPQQPAQEAQLFRQASEAYYKAVYGLSLTVLDIIARGLPYTSVNDIFKIFASNNPAAPLRFLHYPPVNKHTSQRQLGSSAHTDFGAITLLLQDGNEGLEVMDARTQQWVPVPSVRDAYVVNVGDMLSFWTAGEYKSSMHRVINKRPTDRFSIAFFFDGNLDCPLAPMDGSAPADGGAITVEDHMLRRMRESYG